MRLPHAYFVKGRRSVVVGRDDLCSEFYGDPSSLDCEFEYNILLGKQSSF